MKFRKFIPAVIDGILAGALLLLFVYSLCLTAASKTLSDAASAGNEFLLRLPRKAIEPIRDFTASDAVAGQIIAAPRKVANGLPRAQGSSSALGKQPFNSYATATRFGALFPRLGLAPDRLRLLERTIAESDSLLDCLEQADSLQLTYPEAAKERLAACLALLDSAVRDEFGDSVASELRSEILGRTLRDAVGRIAMDNWWGGEPMKTETRALILNSMKASVTLPAGSTDRIELDDINWPQVLTACSGALSPAELRSVEAVQARALFNRRYRDLVKMAPPPRLP